MDPDVPPLTPDQPTAQEWAEQELSKPTYDGSSTGSDWFTELWNDLLEWLLRAPDGQLPIGWIVLIVLAVGAAVAIGYYLAGPARKARDRERASALLSEDDDRSAAQMRASAIDAAAAGDWNLAVLERFRATIRGFEERGVIDERPGRTAFEAARDSGKSLPSHAAGLTDGSRVFDAVCYGHRGASREDYTQIESLDNTTVELRASVEAFR